MNLTGQFHIILFTLISITITSNSSLAAPRLCNTSLHEAKFALESKKPFSEQWKSTFIRSELPTSRDQKKYFKLFLERSTESIFSVFLPWFEGKANSSYLELMTQMRRTLVFGNENIKNFPELSKLSYPELVEFLKLRKMQRKPIAIYSGFFEKQLGKIDYAVDFDLRDENYFLIPLFSENLIKLKKNASKIRFIRNGVIKIPFIENKNFWPKNEVRKYGIIHFYPTGKGVLTEYLNSSESNLLKIRNEFQTLSNESLLNELTHYCYVSIQAHYFNKINNSLIFSQINTILMLKGLNGISHGDLDYYALLVRYQDFEVLFKNAVLEKNPNLLIN